MSAYIHITVEKTKSKKVLKFVLPFSIAKPGTSFVYHNIDEASNSDIAKELFYYPFVKSVYITDNFIAIERYDIAQWEDIESELKSKLESYINAGKNVIKDEENKQSHATVYLESTPNPEVVKFVTNKLLFKNFHEFKSSKEATNSPLAKSLFNFDYITELFFFENYISITKKVDISWDEINQELKTFIETYLLKDKELIIERAENSAKSSSSENSPIEKEIISILDQYIKPAVSADGGNILFKSYDPDKKNVTVLLQGACNGCPSSTFTLKNGIETLLKDMLKDKVESVVAL